MTSLCSVVATLKKLVAQRKAALMLLNFFFFIVCKLPIHILEGNEKTEHTHEHPKFEIPSALEDHSTSFTF